jgi:GT2 family glycosyltransferase
MAEGFSVTIVTFDSARYLARCLDALAAQELPPSEVIVVDNASSDGSAAIARAHAVVSHFEQNARNVGFAAGQNQAIRRSRGSWVLTLNPDVVLTSRFLAELATRAERPAPLGALCGKLLRLGEDGRTLEPPIVDSTGIELSRSFRHFDRGSQQVDRGAWDREEAVFGATAAAAAYRRAMIEDTAIENEFFDEAFFAYREDADVAWRAQLFGWDCLYVPTAVGYHVRRVLPEERRRVAPALNRYSVRNRFLMRIKNVDGAVSRRCGWRGVGRDFAVVAGCLTFEWRSLPALWEVVKLLPRARRQRRTIQSRRVRSGTAIAEWFR